MNVPIGTPRWLSQFNEGAAKRLGGRKKLLSAFTKHGDFSSLVGNWTVEGEIERKQARNPAKWEVVEQPGTDDQGPKTIAKINLAGLEFTLDPLKANPDVRDLKDPPGSGGLLMALYHYRRAAKHLAPPTQPDKFGLVLDVAPGAETEREPVLDGAAA